MFNLNHILMKKKMLLLIVAIHIVYWLPGIPNIYGLSRAGAGAGPELAANYYGAILIYLIGFLEFYIVYFWLFPHFLQKRNFGKFAIFSLLTCLVVIIIGLLIWWKCWPAIITRATYEAFDKTKADQLIAQHPVKFKKSDAVFLLQLLIPRAIYTIITACFIRGFFTWLTEIRYKEQLERNSLQSRLDTIRAQLNPHFVFNALSSIQNLMNKNEVEMANSYLNRFARLTRQVLNDSSLISIKDEMALLDDYLSMEQLRFPFTYEIHADSSNNFLNIEIPAMLLQPFVENAVKHSMSQLQGEGKISISFIKENSQLILMINDNGRGFDIAENYEGWGLKLSKKRIALLNDRYKECPVSMEIQSNDSGTTIKITLAHWL